MPTETHVMKHRICPICEAGCGLSLDFDGRQVVKISGNQQDVFSTGHVCAKGIALGELDTDPDRLQHPLIRQNGKLVPTDWATAWQTIADSLAKLCDPGAQNSPPTYSSVASYIGNPTAHNVGMSLGLNTFIKSLGSAQIYSAGTVDQVPKQLASELMFGNDMAIAVPDIEHCDYLLMLGANPVVSNGSLWLVPKVREKLRALKARGGQLVTVDPRRTETARLATTHHFIRPGTDAWLLAAISNELTLLGRELPQSQQVVGAEQLARSLATLQLADAAARTGIGEVEIQSLARELNAAERPVLYGRVGTTLQQHGTLTSFLLEVIHLQLGVLDRQGGAMFPEQPFHKTRPNATQVAQGRWHSRVSRYPEVLGQMPVAALAEEIDTPGEGQVRALFCFAGNPVVSNPDSARLERALETLDLLVCVDIYHTETSRLADVVLPGTSPFEDGHYDHFLGSMGYRNAARYSPPLFTSKQPDEWDLGLHLGHIAATGRVANAGELAEFEDNEVAAAVGAYVADAESGIAGADPQQIMGLIEPERGVERLLDLGIRAGRWGDHFGAQSGLTLQQLIDAPNGIDLGELRGNRLPEINGYPDQQIQLAPALIIDALAALSREQDSGEGASGSLRLIGRRSTRSNNSWLRNLPMLNQGKNLCTLLMHALDAEPLGVETGDMVCVSSATGEVTVAVEITDDLMPGTVSLPHGFSETQGLNQQTLQPAANYNVLAAAAQVDRPSGTAALNGIPVSVQPSKYQEVRS